MRRLRVNLLTSFNVKRKGRLVKNKRPQSRRTQTADGFAKKTPC